jgi:hypothetical protein
MKLSRINAWGGLPPLLCSSVTPQVALSASLLCESCLPRCASSIHSCPGIPPSPRTLRAPAVVHSPPISHCLPGSPTLLCAAIDPFDPFDPFDLLDRPASRVFIDSLSLSRFPPPDHLPRRTLCDTASRRLFFCTTRCIPQHSPQTSQYHMDPIF